MELSQLLPTLISGVISAIIAATTSAATNKAHTEKRLSAIDARLAVLETKLDNQVERIEKHNQVIERTYECERKIGIIETTIGNLKEVLKHE